MGFIKNHFCHICNVTRQGGAGRHTEYPLLFDVQLRGGTNGWLRAVVKDAGRVPDWEHLWLLSSRKYGMIPIGNTNWGRSHV